MRLSHGLPSGNLTFHWTWPFTVVLFFTILIFHSFLYVHQRRYSEFSMVYHGKHHILMSFGDLEVCQNLLWSILVGWTSIYQLFWCSPGLQGFDPKPFGDLSLPERPQALISLAGGDHWVDRKGAEAASGSAARRSESLLVSCLVTLWLCQNSYGKWPLK